MKIKGWIALDIDGTITQDKYSVPVPVVDYFRILSSEGWKFVFLTGRSFSFSSKILSCFDFPYYFSMQNGSCVLQMPEKLVVEKRYMEVAMIDSIEQALKGLEGALVVYGGFERGDAGFWKREGLSSKYVDYIADIMKREQQGWHEVQSFRDELHDFPVVKVIGPFEQMTSLAERLRDLHNVEFSLIRDPFDNRFYILLITAKGVNKGSSLRNLVQKVGAGIVIAAGNDDNDLPLLQAGDVKIAMSDSPEHLQRIADFIAPPVEELGIITSLGHVIEKLNR